MKSDQLGPGDGLLTPEEEDMLRRVERSKVWRLIRDALCLEREQLFSGTSTISGFSGLPANDQGLWKNHGAILLIQHLLQEGPRLVVWYTRYMDKQREQKEKGATVAKSEREYNPHGLNEPPDFDL